ncbi:MAG: DUF2442 domain-containing protein [Micrococcales bacterium]|nr:DUF2442 domain-containing protein [Micrococcales bacterium]
MTTSVVDASAIGVEVVEGFLRVTLRDGRVLATPLSWFPRLADATPAQLTDWRLIGRGEGIHWSSLDEDVSVAGLLRTN